MEFHRGNKNKDIYFVITYGAPLSSTRLQDKLRYLYYSFTFKVLAIEECLHFKPIKIYEQIKNVLFACSLRHLYPNHVFL
jgi:hypothetical protein